MVADTTDKFQESLLETEVLNSNTDDGVRFTSVFLYPFYNGNVSLFYRRALLLLSEITKKKGQTLFFLVQLKHAKVPPEELLQLYVACIKFVLFFGCQVFLFRLPQYRSLTFEWKQ